MTSAMEDCADDDVTVEQMVSADASDTEGNSSNSAGGQSSSAREISSSEDEKDDQGTEAKRIERKRKSQDASSASPGTADAKKRKTKKKRRTPAKSAESTSDEEEEIESGAPAEEHVLEKKTQSSGGKKTSTGRINKKRKGKNMRKNIKDVLNEEELERTTKEAQAEEMERLRRLQEQRKVRLEEELLAQIQEQQVQNLEAEQHKFLPQQQFRQEPQIVHLSSDDDEVPPQGVSAPLVKPPDNHHHSSDSDIKILSEDEILAAAAAEDDDEVEDPSNSGMHVDDSVNVPDASGRVLVNIGHPATEPDIFLAPQLARTVKAHQIGGIRFLYDNVVESVARVRNSQGFGCILAHSMGLGKTIQVVSFCDIFLRHTDGRRVLCIVPINTVQNWLSEFNQWLPEKPEDSFLHRSGEVRPRNFKIHVLNDALKNLEQRSRVIVQWKDDGGVLLMGYELYRQLANKKPRKRKRKNAGPECIDIEEEDKNKNLLDDIQMALVDPGPELVICDEGHRIKNSHASTSQALKAIKTRRRVVLTGYPLQNNLMEYWCMVDFVRPNFLGTKTEFSNMFERPIQNGQCVDSTPKDVRVMMHRAHVLHTQLKGFVQRRGHKVLQKSLPPKTEHVLLLRLTPTQRSLYKRFIDELIFNRSVSNPLKAFAVCCKIWNHPDVLYNFLRKKEAAEDLDFEMEELLDRVQANGPARAGTKKSTAKAALPPQQQQMSFANANADYGFVTNGPGFNPFPVTPSKKDEISYDWANGIMADYVPGVLENSTKFKVFFSILEETIKAGDRLLLFSQSLLTLNLLEDFLHQRVLPGTDTAWAAGINYFRLDGSTPASERERLINAFNAAPNGVCPGAVPLFIVSTRAGSLGINLVGANRVVVFDASWNPCHDSQAVCRVYRYGQRKPSHIYRLVTDNSIEKKIYDRQVNKQGMADRVVDELNPDSHLSSKEINSLICENEDDPPPVDLPADKISSYPDSVLQNVLYQCQSCLAKAPFAHESLLTDRKDKKLTKAEKRLAERSYQMERGAKVSYSRPSYAAFYPKDGANLDGSSGGGGSNGYTRGSRYFDGPSLSTSYRPGGSMRSHPDSPHFGNGHEFSPHHETHYHHQSRYNDVGSTMQQSTYNGTNGQQHQMHHQRPWQQQQQQYWSQMSQAADEVHGAYQGVRLQQQEQLLMPVLDPQKPSTSGFQASASSHSNRKFPVEALVKQGVSLQELTVPRDMMIPTNSNDQPPVSLRKGQQVMVIRTPKGIYLRMGEKIIKIRLPPGLLDHQPSSAMGTPTAAASATAEDLVTIASSDSSSDKDLPPSQQRLQEEDSNPARDLFRLVTGTTAATSSSSSVSNSPKPVL